jgi:4-hydroxyphenylpyruvate dioxygenase
MIRSIATVSLSGTLPEKLAAIAAAGFDGVEIFENDLLCFDGTPAEVRAMAHDLGLAILLFQPFRDFEGVSAEHLRRNLARARQKFKLMHELGASTVLVCSNATPGTSTSDALIVDQLAELAMLAHDHGIVVGYEALAWGKHVNSYRHAWRLVEAVNLPGLGLVLDSFHTLAIDDSLAELATIPCEKIAFVQIADAPRMAMDVMEWSRHFRCFPGQGDLALDAFTAPILAGGYQGPVSLEVFNDGFRASATRATADDGLRSLLYLEEQANKRLRQGAPAPARPWHAEVQSRPLPAPVHLGFEFLEFAVDEAGRARLAGLLLALGFRLAGRHCSKNVFLYRQGKSNLVLNAEPDCFASNFFQSHGVSLCAVAFRVDNADAGFERAVAFGYRPVPGKTGPNERQIRAVQAPDGSLIYFVDGSEQTPDIYDTDFCLDDAGSGEQGWLSKVDHISLAMPPDAMDAWLLFYKVAFSFKADAAVFLPDPYGLVRSRALSSDTGQVRIVLNSSDSGNTLIGHTLSTYRGAGLHHVAFATADIFTLARTLRASGAPLLAIPQNYYEDLAARFDLDQETLAALAELNIMYDHDPAGGQLLHVYVGQLENRFFIEILERRDGYAGFGAVNAPIRMAAHAQQTARALSEALACQL